MCGYRKIIKALLTQVYLLCHVILVLYSTFNPQSLQPPWFQMCFSFFVCSLMEVKPPSIVLLRNAQLWQVTFTTAPSLAPYRALPAVKELCLVLPDIHIGLTWRRAEVRGTEATPIFVFLSMPWSFLHWCLKSWWKFVLTFRVLWLGEQIGWSIRNNGRERPWNFTVHQTGAPSVLLS